MTAFAEISTDIERVTIDAGPRAAAETFLRSGEEILRNWLTAHGETPTDELKEGFNLLALHRQGAKSDPSFNACRETCRELVYHYNVIVGDYAAGDPAASLAMMRFVVRHLYLFVSGKLEEAKLGEFCCSSKSIRSNGA